MSEKNSEGLQSIGRSITDEMVEALKSIGGSPVDKFEIDFEEEQTGFDVHIQALINEGKPIMFGDKYGVLYIKDHEFSGRKWNFADAVNEHPNGCYIHGNRVHFIWCQTLVTMPESRRNARYSQQKLEQDIRPIDLSDRQLNVDARLLWCKHCINKVSEEILENVMPDHEKYHIAEYGNAEEIARCLKLDPSMEIISPEDGRAGAHLPNARPRNWDKISKIIREKHRYTCAECSVMCERGDNKKLLDVHHIDSDKSNNKSSNLQCLCKFCHGEKHAHYKPTEGQMKSLQGLWKEQNIPHDKRG